MLCFICNHEAVLLIPDRDPDSMVARPICDKCLDDFIKIFDNKILNKIDKFKPEIIIISAGFDAHKRDPLAQINLESEHFYTITKKIVEISNIHSQGKIISFLEGGYDLVGLSESFEYHIKGLSE